MRPGPQRTSAPIAPGSAPVACHRQSWPRAVRSADTCALDTDRRQPLSVIGPRVRIPPGTELSAPLRRTVAAFRCGADRWFAHWLRTECRGEARTGGQDSPSRRIDTADLWVTQVDGRRCRRRGRALRYCCIRVEQVSRVVARIFGETGLGIGWSLRHYRTRENYARHVAARTDDFDEISRRRELARRLLDGYVHGPAVGPRPPGAGEGRGCRGRRACRGHRDQIAVETLGRAPRPGPRPGRGGRRADRRRTRDCAVPDPVWSRWGWLETAGPVRQWRGGRLAARSGQRRYRIARKAGPTWSDWASTSASRISKTS